MHIQVWSKLDSVFIVIIIIIPITGIVENTVRLSY